MRSHQALLLSLTAACTGQSIDHHVVPLPPGGGVQIPEAQTGHVPAQAMSFAPGDFHFTGATAPGSASVTAAPMTDGRTDPTSYGTGAYDITLSGTHYAGSASSLAMLFDDGSGTNYLVFGGYQVYTGSGGTDVMDQYVVLVKASDFAVGGTVALDGADRVALFGTGDPNANEPSTVGAAISGTVTFTAGSLNLGDTITASVQGDFGPVDWGTGGGSGSGSSGGRTISAGAYTLAINGPGRVYCDGSLAGHESDFAAIAPSDLALGGGSVTVATPSSTAITVDGAPIAAGYGATPLELDADSSGEYVGFANLAGSGPDSTTLAGTFLVFDSGSATPTLVYGAAGAGYVTASNDGTCSVAFDAELTQ